MHILHALIEKKTILIFKLSMLDSYFTIDGNYLKYNSEYFLENENNLQASTSKTILASQNLSSSWDFHQEPGSTLYNIFFSLPPLGKGIG